MNATQACEIIEHATAIVRLVPIVMLAQPEPADLYTVESDEVCHYVMFNGRVLATVPPLRRGDAEHIAYLLNHALDIVRAGHVASTFPAEMGATAKGALHALGRFGPTVNAAHREVKGQCIVDDPDEDGRTYYTSDKLREIAVGLLEAADWLDARAIAAGA